MKKLLFVICLFLNINAIIAQTEQQAYKVVADKFQTYYNQDKADEIFNMFAKVMQDVLPLDKTKEMVTGLKAQLGNIVSRKFDKYVSTAALYITKFDKTTLIMQISIDKDNKIDGLYFKPYVADTKPAYQNRETKIFTESDIILKTSSGDIYGTLTTPKGVKSSSMVLFIAGSGPTDRNCNQPGLKTDAFKMLAGELANKGISSVRYDKRGIAASAAALKSEKDIRIENYVDDAVDWVKFLKDDTRFSKIYILGHSEGSLIGILAAKRTNVDGLISIAGSGRPIANVILEQIKTAYPDQLNETKYILDSLRMGLTVKKISPALQPLFHESVQPYLISWIKYNPAQEIKSLSIPVLIIQGTTDLQVKVEDAKLLAEAKPDARLLIIDNMNHVLKQSVVDRSKNLETYTNPDLPLKKELAKEIIKFINK
jgi:uncharacterized protein